jgi:anthranilate synthase component 1
LTALVDERLTAVLHAGANTHCITSAEEKHLAEQDDDEGGQDGGSHSTPVQGDGATRISLVAG